MAGRNLRETDLYEPLRAFLEDQGYTVRGEVRGCDLVAAKGDDVVVIEMKLSLNVDLLIQAVQRKRLTESVYVALPAPLRRSDRERWRGVLTLLRRLEVGMLLVHLDRPTPHVEVCLQPLPAPRRRNLRERRAILREMAGRSADMNTGGSPRGPVMTAYRENALYVAYCLCERGHLSPRELRALDAGAGVQRLLGRNYYGWFERVAPATYAVTASGQAAVAASVGLLPAFAERLRRRVSGGEDAEAMAGADHALRGVV